MIRIQGFSQFTELSENVDEKRNEAKQDEAGRTSNIFNSRGDVKGCLCHECDTL